MSDKTRVVFPLRLGKGIHRKMRIAAALEDKSIHQFVIDAVLEKIEKDGLTR